ncbi:hypothetical protein YC2023_081629 [Brassica napus]
MLNLGKKITWATISSEHNDIIRYELIKMDYIRRSNIIEISGKRRIVTELEVELPTYPRRGINKTSASSASCKTPGSSVSSKTSFSTVSCKTSGSSVSSKTSVSSVSCKTFMGQNNDPWISDWLITIS